jgi:Cys-rich protein (TIGR01571 family)
MSEQKYAPLPRQDIELASVPTSQTHGDAAPSYPQQPLGQPGYVQPVYVVGSQQYVQPQVVRAFVHDQQPRPSAVPAPQYDQRGQIILYGEPCSPQENGDTLPSELGLWRIGLFDNCCAIDRSSCWMSWCCGCFVAGQIAEKLNVYHAQISSLNFKMIVLGYFILIAVSHITNNFGEGDSPGIGLQGIYLVVCVYILRSGMRQRLSIPGTPCNDCAASCCCTPCVLTQMQMQLWNDPSLELGCSCQKYAHNTHVV